MKYIGKMMSYTVNVMQEIIGLFRKMVSCEERVNRGVLKCGLFRASSGIWQSFWGNVDWET